MKINVFKATIMVVMASAVNLVAAPVLNDPSLWNNGGGGAAWGVADVLGSDFTTSLESGTGANDARLRLTPSGGGSITPIGALYASGGNFVGNLQGNRDLTVHFAMTSLNVVPSQNSGDLAFYFVSQNGDRWVYDLTPSGVLNSKVYYSVSLGGDETGWNDTLAPGDSLWNDLANVTQFGFEIYGNMGNPVIQEFEFSNVYFSVPEPETVWMILMVIASLALTFRRRMGEVVQGLRARVKV